MKVLTKIQLLTKKQFWKPLGLVEKSCCNKIQTLNEMQRKYLPLWHTRSFNGQYLEVLPDKLLETPPERYPTHRIQQEVYTKIRIVEQHYELLQAPQQVRGPLFPQREEEEHVNTYYITAKIQKNLLIK